MTVQEPTLMESGFGLRRAPGRRTGRDSSMHIDEHPTEFAHFDDVTDRRWTHEDTYSLKLTVKQVRHLDKIGLVPALPDPSVRLAMVDGSGTPLGEYSTRTINNNRNPVFEESFLFPLQNLTAARYKLILSVWDYDPVLPSTCMGICTTSLSDLLADIDVERIPVKKRLSLVAGAKDMTPVSGQVFIECTVMPQQDAAAFEQSPVAPGRLCHPYHLKERFGHTNLNLTVTSIQGLRLNDGPEAVAQFKDLSLKVKVGRASQRLPIQPQQRTVPDPTTSLLVRRLDMEAKVSLDLSTAFTAGPGLSQQGDIFISLMSKGTVLATAQIPLWTINFPSAAASSNGNAVAPTTPPRSATGSPTGGKELSGAEGVANEAQSSTMELINKALTHPLTCEYTAQLVETASQTDEPIDAEDLSDSRTTSISGAAAAGGDEGGVKDEAMGEAVPKEVIPPQLDNVLVNETLPVGPNRLFELTDGRTSSLMKSLQEKACLTNVNFPEWSGELGGPDCSRKVTYGKPWSAGIKSGVADVTDEQKVVAKKTGGWVITTRIATTAPMGDCFEVLFLVVAEQGSAGNSCNLTVSMKINFLKSTMLKGVISSSATADAKQHWAEVCKGVKKAAAAATKGPARPAAAGFAVEPMGEALPADKIPAAFDTVLLQDSYTIGPNRVFDLLTGPHSSFMNPLLAKQNLSNIRIPEWDGQANSTRNVTYKKPWSAGIKSGVADVTEEQKVAMRTTGGWVITVRITTTAPMGDCFEVLFLHVCQQGSTGNSCSLTVTMKVNFLKSSMLKGVITSSALADAKKHWTEVGVSLKKQRPAAAAGAPAAAMATALQETVSEAISEKPQAGASMGPFPPVALTGQQVLYAVAAIGVLLVLLFSYWLSARSYHSSYRSVKAQVVQLETKIDVLEKQLAEVKIAKDALELALKLIKSS